MRPSTYRRILTTIWSIRTSTFQTKNTTAFEPEQIITNRDAICGKAHVQGFWSGWSQKSIGSFSIVTYEVSWKGDWLLPLKISLHHLHSTTVKWEKLTNAENSVKRAIALVHLIQATRILRHQLQFQVQIVWTCSAPTSEMKTKTPQYMQLKFTSVDSVPSYCARPDATRMLQHLLRVLNQIL